MIPVIRHTLQRALRMLARRVVFRYHPTVIGVTGSVGKTSSVQAIALVLGSLDSLRVSPKNYNNELGVPLAVLDQESGLRSPLRWLTVLWDGIRQGWGARRRYPARLVLELGVDKPQDMAYLVEFLQPKIAVVTAVSAVHLATMKTVAAVAAEKGRLVAALPADGTAVLNADEPLAAAMAKKTKARVITYGMSEGALLRAVGVRTTYGTDAEGRLHGGIACTVQYKEEIAPLSLPNVLGEAILYAPLAGIAVGVAEGMRLRDAVAAASPYQPPPGRSRLVPGIKRSAIIDDSYNSSPSAAAAAVRLLDSVPSRDGQKFAVLGDMLELGRIAGRAHRELGALVATSRTDILVAVGELSRDIARGAREAGMPEERVFTFPDAATAGRFLQDRLEPGDVLLVKGSQGVRMERVVKELMAEPQRAQELLVRQGPEWPR
ncbi:MAG: UDP-N-acetylmuramoyl-tripeptide--D-alanyl-D-alanine ligase [Parcubacteria group bacterium Gr01-1014_31]|nr:MAG: UDP-N-acetylmuramoyl-tripeptide--D-alanyl-D-alanine ligase [Parcubacteria group bacterium Gr01-1014_31]